MDADDDLDPSDLVDTKKAAELLQLDNVKTLYRWRRDGKVRGYRRGPYPGGRWFYSRRELERLFVPSGSAVPLPPTQAACKRRDAAANAELAAKGW